MRRPVGVTFVPHHGVRQMTLAALIDHVRSEEMYLRMGAIDEGELEENGGRRADLVVAELKAAIVEIDALRDHACEFDADDYCRVCRSDGRS